MSSSQILKTFNDHFIEFVSDVQSVFPENVDLLTAKNAFLAIRKANPRIIVKIFKAQVVDPYQKEIDSGDLGFFIVKDYANDLADADNSKQIMDAIDGLRNPVRQMDSENQAKVMKYLQNLKKLAIIYESM
uniref:Uncharacterized protein n=1 Tax=viral metagenome TaxID=1070528 RepID=A0A6C0F4X1_9ZZZZ